MNKKTIKAWCVTDADEVRMNQSYRLAFLVGMCGVVSLLLILNSQWTYGSHDAMFMRSVQKLTEAELIDVRGVIRITDNGTGEGATPLEFYYDGHVVPDDVECLVDLYLHQNRQSDDISVGRILVSGDDNTVAFTIMGTEVSIPVELNHLTMGDITLDHVEVTRRSIDDVRPGFGHMKRNLVCYSYMSDDVEVDAYVDSSANLICISFRLGMGQMLLEGDVIL